MLLLCTLHKIGSNEASKVFAYKEIPSVAKADLFNPHYYSATKVAPFKTCLPCYGLWAGHVFEKLLYEVCGCCAGLKQSADDCY